MSGEGSGRPMDVLVLGLDGASWKIIDPLCACGRLPHLQALLEAGSSCSLQTLDCLLSPVIWTSIATGKMPDKHGVHSFAAQRVMGKTVNLEWRWKKLLIRYLGRPYELAKRAGLVKSIPPSSAMRTARTVWEILEDEHRPCGVVGWWGTWPPAPLSGGVVADRAYHLLEGSTYPDRLLSEVAQLKRGHKEIDLSVARQFLQINSTREAEFRSGAVREDRWFGYAYRSDAFFVGSARHLMSCHPDYSYFVYLRGIDILEHAFWHYVEPQAFPDRAASGWAWDRYGDTVERYYIYIDSVLGQFIGSLRGDRLVVVVSDHGMRASPGQVNSGDHDDEAVLVISGPNVAHRSRQATGHVTDVVPTLLYLMGLPVGRDMDGRVLTEMVDGQYLAANPIEYVESYERQQRRADYPESDVDEEVIQRLRDLGYVD